MGNEQFDPDPFALHTATGELPADDVLRLFADRRARYAVVYLADHPTPTLEELANVIAAKDASVEGTIATPADRDRVRIRLYHAILPKLESLGFITYDGETNAVTETDIPPVVIDALGVTDRSS